jgi:predicted nuclease of predicted toxin-antitoxin system
MAEDEIRFIVDECTGPLVAKWLLSKNYQVLSIYDNFKGIKDFEILRIAQEEKWVIITNDKDFGELVYKNNFQHHGIVLLRLIDERSSNKIDVLEKLIDNHFDELKGKFIVVTENSVRIIKPH